MAKPFVRANAVTRRGRAVALMTQRGGAWIAWDIHAAHAVLVRDEDIMTLL